MFENLSLGRQSTLKYVAALCLLFSVSFCSYVLQSNQLNTNLNDSYLINLSGMQGMLSQRISLLSFEAYTISENKDDTILQLENAISLMEETHNILRNEIEESNRTSNLGENLYDVYFSDDGINQSVNRYLLSANAYLQESKRTGASNEKQLLLLNEMSLRTRSGLLENFNSATNTYQAIAEEKIKLFKKLELTSLVITLVVLVLSGLYIFKPLVKQIIAHVESTQRIFDAAPNGMLMISNNGLIEMINDEAALMFGYEKNELKGEKIEVLVPQNIRHSHIKDRDNFLTNATSRRMGEGKDLFGIKKDGSKIAVEIGLNPIKTTNGISTITGVINTTERLKRVARLNQLMDELKSSNDDLQRSNSDLEQFAYVASHDLQEPLRMVSSYTQLLASRYQGKLDEDADKFIEYAVDGAKRMQALIQDLLKYSKLNSSEIILSDIDSNTLCDYACTNLEIRIKETDTTITKESLPMVRGDVGQLRLLFQNLIGNAIKYSDPNKKNIVNISAKPNGSYWEFCVKDNGIGIKKEYYEKVFVIFRRLHLNTEYDGTGIGLALCKKIIDQLGGKIWIESEFGEGSQFYFTLPRAEDHNPEN